MYAEKHVFVCMENGGLHALMCLSLLSYAAHVRHYAEISQPLAFKNRKLYTSHHCYCASCTTYHCLLLMKSLNMSLCLLLSLGCVFNVPACINVSHPPHRLLIYESYLGLSLLPPEGSIDVESVMRRIASCPQTS